MSESKPTERRQEPRFDSRPDTYAHIGQVRGLVLGAAQNLTARAHVHDRSKLESPEVETFDRVSPLLSELEYGSPGYQRILDSMKPALKHHYAENDHHPEHFGGLVSDMNLLQLTEMLCDWIAAGRRHDPPTDPHDSIDMNSTRFGYGEEIKRLLHNSVDALIEAELP